MRPAGRRLVILVTGATGTVGSHVARRLVGRGPMRILARRPDRVTVQGPGVEVVAGEYADYESLVRALTGVRAAFLVTSHLTEPDDEVFVAAARTAGLRHLVKLSAYGVNDPGAQDVITRRQRQNEQTLRDSGLHWTFLQPRAFMSNALGWAPSVRAEGAVRAFNGSVAHTFVDPRDVANVAVRALTERGHEGKAYRLTGPEAITAAQQTMALSRVLGRALRFEDLTEEQTRAQLLRRHPPVVTEALMQGAQRRLQGGSAQPTTTVGDLTGRTARPFLTWAADHATAFV